MKADKDIQGVVNTILSETILEPTKKDIVDDLKNRPLPRSDANIEKPKDRIRNKLSIIR